MASLSWRRKERRRGWEQGAAKCGAAGNIEQWRTQGQVIQPAGFTQGLCLCGSKEAI
uniref:Uncharacterized protein n=1 Tax=Arundo donax TaxID=35708 RepID=A0A0A9H695_ARUDO